MEEIQNTTPVSSNEPVKRSRFPLLLGILFALLAVGGLFYYLLHAKNSSSQIEEVVAPNETYLQLKDNPDFISAQQASVKGDYRTAINLYKGIIPATSAQNSYLQYEIAANALSLDGPIGIQVFGGLIASSSINFENKAYAFVFLTNYYTLTRSTGTLALIQTASNSWQETVKEEYLTMLRTANNLDDARIALMEMSTSLYPTSAAEAWLGYLYARKAQELHTTTPENKEVVQEYAKKARDHIAIADTDPDKTKESENLRSTIPMNLMRKAMALMMLEKIGETEENPSLAFENAIDSAIEEKENVPFFYYNYALYLMSKQEPDEEKIRSLLAKIIEMKDDRAFPILRDYIRNVTTSSTTSESIITKKLFTIYPPFEESVR